MSDGAPAYRNHVLHFDAPRLVALREGGRIEEALATENEGKCLHAHPRTCTLPTQLFAARASLQPTPSPLCELALWPLLWRPALYIWGVIPDLT